jgi:hypothetical protein
LEFNGLPILFHGANFLHIKEYTKFIAEYLCCKYQWFKPTVWKTKTYKVNSNCAYVAIQI